MAHYDHGTHGVHGALWPCDTWCSWGTTSMGHMVFMVQCDHGTFDGHVTVTTWHVTSDTHHMARAVTGHTGRGERSTQGTGDAQWRRGNGHIEWWWHGPQWWHVDRQSQGRAVKRRAGWGRQIAAHTGQVWLDSGQHRVRMSTWWCNWQCLFWVGSTLASVHNFGWPNIPIGTQIYCLQRRCLAAHIVYLWTTVGFSAFLLPILAYTNMLMSSCNNVYLFLLTLHLPTSSRCGQKLDTFLFNLCICGLIYAFTVAFHTLRVKPFVMLCCILYNYVLLRSSGLNLRSCVQDLW